MMVVEQFHLLAEAEEDMSDTDQWSNKEGLEVGDYMPGSERYLSFCNLKNDICIWDVAMCRVVRTIDAGMQVITNTFYFLCYVVALRLISHIESES